MIINSKEFQAVCKTVLNATDNSELSTITVTLELKTVGNILYLSTTNKEYYCSIKFPLEHEEEFRASVNATLFLKLIAAITSETIELTVANNALSIKANGNYKLPLIFEGEDLMGNEAENSHESGAEASETHAEQTPATHKENTSHNSAVSAQSSSTTSSSTSSTSATRTKKSKKANNAESLFE